MKAKSEQRFDIVLISITVLSAFLNFFYIWKNTDSNAYYTAAVTSMLQSWHNFFFASFDPAGFITVDKPPVAFWIQSLFAYIFGVHGWSVVLPQALAGVGSVILIYFLVKTTFGITAARLASLIMACSPIAVAVSRTNNIDSLLVFTLLFSTWMLFRGIRNQQMLWVIGAFAMIGVGFNMKMLQAYMVVPAFYLFYLLAFKSEWKKKLAVLAAATIVLVGVSLSWALVVDSISKDNRPYIGGSQTNSVLELALGYNGINRLTGMNHGGGGAGAPNGSMPGRMTGQDEGESPRNNLTGERISPDEPVMGKDAANNPRPEFNPGTNGEGGQPPGAAGKNQGSGMGGGGMFGTGQAGPLRLFQSELSGQISWLLPLAALAAIALLAGIRRRKPLTANENEAIFWLTWLIPGMAFFSIAGFFHQYYLIMLAPPIAVLAGAGWVELLNCYRRKEGLIKWLLPIALLTTAAFELYILYPYRQQIGMGWLIGMGTAATVLSLVLLLASQKEKISSVAATTGILVLLAAPLYWAATPIIYGDNSMLPQAGLGQGRMGSKPAGGDEGGGGMGSGVNAKLLAYVSQNNGGEEILFATSSASTAEAYIIQTGKTVIAMGGFSGSDPALTVDKLQQMVKDKKIKYFLISSGSDGRGGAGNNEVMTWIRAHSTEIPKEEWQSGSLQGSPTDMRGGDSLYQINV